MYIIAAAVVHVCNILYYDEHEYLHVLLEFYQYSNKQIHVLSTDNLILIDIILYNCVYIKYWLCCQSIGLPIRW